MESKSFPFLIIRNRTAMWIHTKYNKPLWVFPDTKSHTAWICLSLLYNDKKTMPWEHQHCPPSWSFTGQINGLTLIFRGRKVWNCLFWRWNREGTAPTSKVKVFLIWAKRKFWVTSPTLTETRGSVGDWFHIMEYELSPRLAHTHKHTHTLTKSIF